MQFLHLQHRIYVMAWGVLEGLLMLSTGGSIVAWQRSNIVAGEAYVAGGVSFCWKGSTVE